MSSWNDDRFEELSGRVDAGFAKIDARFDKVDEKFERFYRLLFISLVSVIVGLMGCITALIATRAA